MRISIVVLLLSVLVLISIACGSAGARSTDDSVVDDQDNPVVPATDTPKDPIGEVPGVTVDPTSTPNSGSDEVPGNSDDPDSDNPDSVKYCNSVEFFRRGTGEVPIYDGETFRQNYTLYVVLSYNNEDRGDACRVSHETHVTLIVRGEDFYAEFPQRCKKGGEVCSFNGWIGRDDDDGKVFDLIIKIGDQEIGTLTIVRS